MTRRVALAAAVLGAALLAALPALAADEPEIEIVDLDTGRFPEVSVDIALPPELVGQTLTADDFVVAENGRRIPAAIWAAAEQPMEVLLLLDTSGSMEGAALAAAREAGLEFVRRLPESADVGVVTFGDEVTVAAALEDSRTEVEEALGALSAGGETALFDAVAAAPSLFGGDAEMRRVVVVLSDGADTVSSGGLDGAAAALASTGAEVFAVALESSEADRDALSDLMRPAGGRVVETGDVAQLADLYRSIADEILGRYTVTFESRASGPVVWAIGVEVEETMIVGSARFEAPSVDEPAVVATTGSTPTGTEDDLPVATEFRAPEPEMVPDPGPMQQEWTLWGGAAAVFLASVVGMALLLRQREERPGVGEMIPAVAGRARGLLSLVSRGAESAVDGVLKRRRGGRLDAALDRAGVALRPTEFVVLGAAVAVSGFALGLTVGGPGGALVLGGPALLAPKLALRVLTSRRRAAFSDQLEGTLQMMASSLRAGYGLLQAIQTAASESPSPTAEEFDRVIVENRLGRPLVQSLDAMADRMEDDDLRWVVEAIDIQQEVGGNLAEVLETVTTTIRERNQIRRQIKALSAEGRMSAIILLALPFGLAGLISMISPDYIAELTSSTLGKVLMVVGLLLMGAGAAWIRRIVKVVF